MRSMIKQLTRKGMFWLAILVVPFLVALSFGHQVGAIGSTQTPQGGSVGLEGTISAPPPKQGATIAVPGNGQTVNGIPITVSGLCPTGLLVKVFSNNVFVGAVPCTNGSYSLQINLFSGQNDLVARVYDALDQAGPDSNLVTVTFNDAQFVLYGTRVALSSNYAELGADPGKELDWPLLLSGGNGPYAISIDWGDGTAPTLMSLASPGPFTAKHVYASAGIYRVIVKATDANGTTAFLQLVGVANGKIAQGTSNTNKTSGGLGTTEKTVVIWWPMLVLLPLIVVAFWLGRRHELYAIRKQLEHSRDEES